MEVASAWGLEVANCVRPVNMLASLTSSATCQAPQARLAWHRCIWRRVGASHWRRSNGSPRIAFPKWVKRPR
eukprot:3553790-Pyramimonas_sp.AAC.1